MLQKSRFRPSDPAVYLIGPMGSGKSAVGQQLARRLHVEFIDVDREIESRTEQTIAEIFDADAGESRFRDLETAVLGELSGRRGIVVATGGGAIMREENRRAIRNGTVIYLHASAEQQYDRIKNNTHRPLLQTDDPKSVLASLMKTRHPMYHAEADIVMHTDGQTSNRVAEIIERKLLSS